MGLWDWDLVTNELDREGSPYQGCERLHSNLWVQKDLGLWAMGRAYGTGLWDGAMGRGYGT